MRRLRNLPLIVLALAATGLMMAAPAAYGLATGDRALAMVFAQTGVLVLLMATLLAVATLQRRPRNAVRGHFVSLLAAYALVPVVAALPLAGPFSAPLLAEPEVTRGLIGTAGLRFFDAWFEMVSSFTTTGATLLAEPGAVAPGIHLWRALVGWGGGFFVLFVAIAILAPVNLGGVEVETGHPPGRVMAESVPPAPGTGPGRRRRAMAQQPVPGRERFGPGVEGAGLVGAGLVGAGLAGAGLAGAGEGAGQSRRAVAGARRLNEDEAGLRIWTSLRFLTPVYVGLTAGLWIALILAGESPLVAACHAMSVLATSGISPVGGLEGAQAGRAGELLILLCFVFAFSRRALPGPLSRSADRPLRRDHELRAAAFVLITLTMVLFLRQFAGAAGQGGGGDLMAAARALWGSVFTLASFLSTTGFVSGDWAASRLWSGLPPPGLALAGLALIGGGVATTAGGIGLLRAYALYRHGMHEMDKLLHPSLVAGRGARARALRSQGAYAAWLALMLVLFAMAAVLAALTITGVDFEAAMILTVAALSTTGPLSEMVAAGPIRYGDLPDAARAILGAAMVIGRLELLAVIALLTPGGWRGWRG